jgi:hypothetical protein
MIMNNSINIYIMSLIENFSDNLTVRYLNLKNDSLIRLFKDMDENINLDPLIE